MHTCKFKRILSVLLALTALALLAACGGDAAPAETTADTTAAPETAPEPASIKLADLAKYNLIRSADAESTMVDLAIELLKGINQACGTEIVLKDDFYREGNPNFAIGEFEILVGATNRPETAEFLRGLRYKDYGYALIGNKLVIGGHTAETIKQAVSLFRVNVLGADAAARADFFTETDNKIKTANYTCDTMTLGDHPISMYTIVYNADNKQLEKNLAERLHAAVAETSGYVLPVVSSKDIDAVGCCIVIGATPVVSVETGNYILGVEPNGETVHALGADSVGHAAAVQALIARLTPTDDAKAVACTLDGLTPTELKDTTLSAMSFNVYVGNFVPERRERVLRQIQDHLPDTLGVQEASDEWMLYLKRELSGYYDYVGIGRDNGKGEHSAVFYAKDKFDLIDSGTKWLSDTPDVTSKYPTSSLNRIFSYAVLERKSDGARFMHVNTHFDHKSDTARQQQAGALLKFLEDYPTMPIVCTGDFNTGYGGAIHKTLIAGRLADSVDIVSGAKRQPTFHNYGSASSYIDFCFVTDDKILPTLYKVCNNEVLGDFASDHHPVYIEYQLIG